MQALQQRFAEYSLQLLDGCGRLRDVGARDERRLAAAQDQHTASWRQLFEGGAQRLVTRPVFQPIQHEQTRHAVATVMQNRLLPIVECAIVGAGRRQMARDFSEQRQARRPGAGSGSLRRHQLGWIRQQPAIVQVEHLPEPPLHAPGQLQGDHGLAAARPAAQKYQRRARRLLSVQRIRQLTQLGMAPEEAAPAAKDGRRWRALVGLHSRRGCIVLEGEHRVGRAARLCGKAAARRPCRRDIVAPGRQRFWI